MGLRQALDHLPADRATESTIREVLRLMRVRVGEPMAAARIADRIGGQAGEVTLILSTLADYSVLERHGDEYAYPRNLVVDVEVERFTRRVEAHSRYVRQNVAKFRDRYGQK
jgi:hypothetical protein